MAAKHKAFIVLMFGDRTGDGFEEAALPALVAMIDSASPDYRQVFTAHGVAGFFLASAAAAESVESLIAEAEHLRTFDVRFASLGIGVSTGEMVAEFNWLGRLRSAPVGVVGNEASRLVSSAPDAYLPSLTSIRRAYCHA